MNFKQNNKILIFQEFIEQVVKQEIEKQEFSEENSISSGNVVGYTLPLGMDTKPGHKLMWSGDEKEKKKLEESEKKERISTDKNDYIGGKHGVDSRGIKFYHASARRFRHGDVISGGHSGGYGSCHKNVCMTTDPRPHGSISSTIPGWHGSSQHPQDQENSPDNDKDWYVYEVEPIGKVFYLSSNREYQAKSAKIIKNLGKAISFVFDKSKDPWSYDDPKSHAHPPDVEKNRKEKHIARQQQRLSKVDQKLNSSDNEDQNKFKLETNVLDQQGMHHVGGAKRREPFSDTYVDKSDTGRQAAIIRKVNKNLNKKPYSLHNPPSMGISMDENYFPKNVIEEPGFVYHATNIENAFDILSSGNLETHSPDYGTDQDTWPDGKIENRSYFASRPSKAESFYPLEGNPILLRIPISSGKFRKENGTGDIYSRFSISSSFIQFWNQDSHFWLPLEELNNILTETASDHPDDSINPETSKKLLILNQPKLINKGININNIKQIGVGSMGVAYDIGDNRVLKVTGDFREAKASNILVGKDIPNIIRIYDAFRFPNTNYFGIITEKLTPLSNEEATRLTNAVINTKFPVWLHQANDDWNLAMQILARKSMEEAVGKAYKQFPDAKNTTGLKDPRVQNFIKEFTSKVIKDFDQLTKRYKMRDLFRSLKSLGIQFYDFHGGNFGLRDDGTLVLFDPGGSKSKGPPPMFLQEGFLKYKIKLLT